MITDHDITIRQATAEDIPGIARVHVESWRSTYRGIVPEDYLERLSYEDAEGRWGRWLSVREERLNILVAEDQGTIVGFASGGKSRDTNRRYTGELYAIYLLEGEQGKGTGRRLFEEMASCLRHAGHTSMFVWVLTQNPSRRFYSHMGGELIETKTITIGGAELEEEAYGWKELGG